MLEGPLSTGPTPSILVTFPFPFLDWPVALPRLGSKFLGKINRHSTICRQGGTELDCWVSEVGGTENLGQNKLILEKDF